MSKVLSCYLPHLTLHPPPHPRLQPKASHTRADRCTAHPPSEVFWHFFRGTVCSNRLYTQGCGLIWVFLLKDFCGCFGFRLFLLLLLFVCSQNKMFKLLPINIGILELLWHSHLGNPQVSCAETPQLEVNNFNITYLHSQSNESPWWDMKGTQQWTRMSSKLLYWVSLWMLPVLKSLWTKMTWSFLEHQLMQWDIYISTSQMRYNSSSRLKTQLQIIIMTLKCEPSRQAQYNWISPLLWMEEQDWMNMTSNQQWSSPYWHQNLKRKRWRGQTIKLERERELITVMKMRFKQKVCISERRGKDNWSKYEKLSKLLRQNQLFAKHVSSFI